MLFRVVAAARLQQPHVVVRTCQHVRKRAGISTAKPQSRVADNSGQDQNGIFRFALIRVRPSWFFRSYSEQRYNVAVFSGDLVLFALQSDLRRQLGHHARLAVVFEILDA